MNEQIGNVVALREKFSKEDVVAEVLKAKRKGFLFVYISTNVYQMFMETTNRDPYADMAITTVMGMQIRVSGNLFDNVLLFTKVLIYKG